MTGIGSIRLNALKRSNLATTDYGESWGGLDRNLVRPLVVPDHLRIPSMKWDPNLYYLNMVANVITIRIHQEALAKVGVKNLHPDALRESERICLESALEIASIMRSSCHVDLSAVCAPATFQAVINVVSDQSIHLVLLVCRRNSTCPNQEY